MEKPHDCDGCSLVNIGEGFTKQEGSPKLGIAFYGEANGKHEIQEELPFRKNGESGALLQNILDTQINITDPEDGKKRKAIRGDFIWDNAAKCRPPENKLNGTSYEKSAVDHCKIYNNRSIDRPDVKLIVAFGSVAFKALTGIEGKKRGIEDVRGYVFKSDNKLIIPTLDPSFIRHGNSRFTSAIIHDIKKAISVANGSFTSYEYHGDFVYPELLIRNKVEALVAFYKKVKANPELVIYYDIENPYTKTEEEDDKGDEEAEQSEPDTKPTFEITSIQFSCTKDWAITVPWAKPFIRIAQAILALSNLKVGSNCWHHDNPRLEANGCIIDPETNHDLMWAWKHIQPGLWKGLQRIGSFFSVPFTWKHLAFEEDKEDEYGGMDVIAPAYIWPSLVQMMKRHGVWDSYIKFKLQYRARVLRSMELRGFPVDETRRQELKTSIELQVAEEDTILQREIPEELRNITPKRKDKETGEFDYGYKREPKVISELRPGYKLTESRLIARGIQPENILCFEKWAERKTGLSYREFESTGDGVQQELDLFEEDRSIGRWCNIEPFKASSQQLIKYMKFKGYKIPLTLKEKRETTAKKELYEVYEKTNDPVLESTIKIRSLDKMLSNDIPNWTPASDGAVHTTFKFDPPSWQLNSSGPNIQNARKHEPDPIAKILRLGERFRRIVVAPPGRCVIEFDKRAFHVVMMGFEARDPSYIRFAKLDMHSLITSYIVGQPIPFNLSDADTLLAIREIKKHFKIIRDTQGKPTVLGNQLGLGAHKLWWSNKTYIDENGKRQIGIPSKKVAEKLQELIDGLFSKCKIYKRKIKEEAHYKTYLKSNFGAIRWFYDVLRWDYKTRSFKNGSEAEEAQSHRIQADAFGMIHSELIEMGNESNILEEHWVANTVHDSVVAFPEIGKRDRCIEEIRSFMHRPRIELSDPICAPNGLVVETDVMCSPVGGNWAPFHKERNPLGIQEIKI